MMNHLDFTIAVTALAWSAAVFVVQIALHLHACMAPAPPPKFSDKMPMQRVSSQIHHHPNRPTRNQ